MEKNYVQIRMVSHLSSKPNRKYAEMCGFVKERMALEIVHYNNLLLSIPWEK